jgi:predicted MFS family arabinose efflux permease
MALQLSATAGLLTLSVLSFCLLSSMASAIFIEIFHGFANIIAILSVYIIATRVCPRRIEITVMAVLVAVRNIATDGATFIGGQLATNLFQDSYHTLALTSCVAPALSFFAIAGLLSNFERGVDQAVR